MVMWWPPPVCRIGSRVGDAGAREVWQRLLEDFISVRGGEVSAVPGDDEEGRVDAGQGALEPAMWDNRSYANCHCISMGIP